MRLIRPPVERTQVGYPIGMQPHFPRALRTPPHSRDGGTPVQEATKQWDNPTSRATPALTPLLAPEPVTHLSSRHIAPILEGTAQQSPLSRAARLATLPAIARVRCAPQTAPPRARGAPVQCVCDLAARRASCRRPALLGHARVGLMGVQGGGRAGGGAAGKVEYESARAAGAAGVNAGCVHFRARATVARVVAVLVVAPSCSSSFL